METLKLLSEYGVWDILSILILVISFIVAGRYLWFPIRDVEHLAFSLRHIRDNNADFPSRLEMEIINNSHTDLVLSNVYFKVKNLVNHPHARGDNSSKKFELKFYPDWKKPFVLISHSDSARTFFPIDPKISDHSVEHILKNGYAGEVVCKCTFLTTRPRTVKFIRNIQL